MVRGREGIGPGSSVNFELTICVTGIVDAATSDEAVLHPLNPADECTYRSIEWDTHYLCGGNMTIFKTLRCDGRAKASQVYRRPDVSLAPCLGHCRVAHTTGVQLLTTIHAPWSVAPFVQYHAAHLAERLSPIYLRRYERVWNISLPGYASG